jgi:Calx-beta domain
MKPITITKKISGAIVLLGILIFASCTKSNDPVIATVKFSSAIETDAENKGTVTIPVTLSSKLNSDVVINYTWSSSDTTTLLGGDFTLPTTLAVTIKAGETAGNISIQIIDDTQIDRDDIVNLTLTTSSSTSAKISTVASETKFVLTITNNDLSPNDALQADLTWHLSDKALDINPVNLDVYLVYNYSVTNGTINATTLRSSLNTTGFETVSLKSTDTDQKYWYIINYTTGTTALNFTLNLNGFGKTNYYGSSSFKATEKGYAITYGPFTKSGSSISGRTEAPEFSLVRKGVF